jgi:hypothetical protein
MKKKEEKPKALKRHVTARRRVPRAEGEIEEGLRVIYGEKPQDLHVVDRGVSPLTYYLVRTIIGLGVVALMVGAGLFVMSKGFLGSHDGSALELSVAVPPDVRSGEETTIEIPYSNTEGVPIAALDIDVNVPSGFLITSTSPTPTNTDELIFTIGSLGPHSDGKITLQGLWIAPVTSTNNIQAIASYRPGNFNSIFSAIATGSITTKSSVLTETITGPDSAVPGQSLTYTVEINHTGDVPIENAELEVAFPNGFVLSSSSPKLEPAAPPLFPLGTLAPKSKTTVTLTGAFSSEITDVQTITAEVKVLKYPTEKLAQATGNWRTDVKGGSLRLSLVANGLTGNVAAEPGGALKLSFRLENAGTAPVSDASVILDFQPGTGVPITWSAATLDGGTLSKDGALFDAKKIGLINPGEKKTFNLSFPIKGTFVAGDLDSFTVVAKASTATTSLLSTPVNVNVNAAVSLDAYAHYYSADGAPIGSGPLPPRVNEATTYEVVWSISHALHALDDLTVSATLPPGVTFANNVSVSAGELTYDEVNRTLRYDVSNIAQDAGTVTAKFFVTATPGDEDEGEFMKILSGTALRVTDTKTGARIDRTADALTTEIPKDTNAAGKGAVAINEP